MAPLPTSFTPDAVYTRMLGHSLHVPDTDCYVWCGAGWPHYGRIQWEGKLAQVHRVSYFLEHGHWPEIVLHMCDNPPCWNPDHLSGGTQRDNVEDMIVKGRAVYNKVGSANSYAKLTEDSVRMIKGLLNSGLLSHEDIGNKFGVSRRTISFIAEGITWRHVQ